MKIGIQLPEVERVVPWPEYARIARAAEEAGFDSVWVGDHLLYADPPRGPWECWTTMAALAAATERVRIGPLVACAAFHPPAVLAKMAATIAEISDGRFVLGLGAGWNRVEFDAFGIPYDRRVDRFAEAFATIRRLLRDEDDVTLQPRPGRVPLMIGSNGPRMLELALPHVDAWNTWWADYGNTADGFHALHTRLGIPSTVTRSACALVALGDGPHERRFTDDAPPIRTNVAERVSELGDAGADEVIVVLSPITEVAVRHLGVTLSGLMETRERTD